MSKLTLADMDEDKRKTCVGMWCDFPDPNERTNLAIYIGESTKHDGFCEIIHEGELSYITIPENLTPRPDLPRAWNPDGTPLDADVEEHTTDDRRIVLLNPWVETRYPPNTKVRRWTTHWEAVE